MKFISEQAVVGTDLVNRNWRHVAKCLDDLTAVVMCYNYHSEAHYSLTLADLRHQMFISDTDQAESLKHKQ